MGVPIVGTPYFCFTFTVVWFIFKFGAVNYIGRYGWNLIFYKLGRKKKVRFTVEFLVNKYLTVILN